MQTLVDIDTILQKLSDFTKTIHTPILDLVAIQTADPFKILVGTLLSARTKDETTAYVLKKLFSRIATAEELEKLSIAEITDLIFPIGFYRTKARHLKSLAKILIEKYHSKVPDNMDDLLTLPGVGRKTANLVLILAFDQPAMCVDTHVHRISNRLGMIKTHSPAESEDALRNTLDIKHWKTYNSILVAFGQTICRPINPKCTICPIKELCPCFTIPL